MPQALPSRCCCCLAAAWLLLLPRCHAAQIAWAARRRTPSRRSADQGLRVQPRRSRRPRHEPEKRFSKFASRDTRRAHTKCRPRRTARRRCRRWRASCPSTTARSIGRRRQQLLHDSASSATFSGIWIGGDHVTIVRRGGFLTWMAPCAACARLGHATCSPI